MLCGPFAFSVQMSRYRVSLTPARRADAHGFHREEIVLEAQLSLTASAAACYFSEAVRLPKNFKLERFFWTRSRVLRAPWSRRTSPGDAILGSNSNRNIARWRVSGSRIWSAILRSRGIPSRALFRPALVILQRRRWTACIGGSGIATITISPRRCDRRWYASETDRTLTVLGVRGPHS